MNGTLVYGVGMFFSLAPILEVHDGSPQTLADPG